MLPVTSWSTGWSSKSYTRIKQMCGLKMTVDAYITALFGEPKLKFTGAVRPHGGLIPVPGWSDFQNKNKGA